MTEIARNFMLENKTTRLWNGRPRLKKEGAKMPPG